MDFLSPHDSLNMLNKLKAIPVDKDVYCSKAIVGARLTDAMHIRIPKHLGVFIKTLALIEGGDYSSVARRLITFAAMEEGYDPNGC